MNTTQVHKPQDWLTLIPQLRLLTIKSEQEEEKLRYKSAEVGIFGKELKQFCQALVEHMAAEKGIGLAAVQMGVLQRIFVTQLDESQPPLIVINPVIQPTSVIKELGEEGCLSIPGIYADVERYPSVELKAQNPYGKTFKLYLEGLDAVCAQHENDHLDGILFTDYLHRSQQKKVMKHFKKQQDKVHNS